MSRTPCCSSFFGIGSWPHSGMPGRALRAGALQHEHASPRRRRAPDRRCARPCRCSRGTRRRGPVWRCRCGFHRRRLDHRAVGREVAAQHREAVALDQRLRRAGGSRRRCRPSAPARFSPSVLAVDGERRRVEQVGELRQQAAQAAGVVEVLHQVLARRAQVGEHRRAARERVEARRGRAATPARRAIAIRCTIALVEPPSASTVGDRVVERARVDDVARLRGPPTPSRRCACPTASPSARGASRAPGSTRRRAASGPALRRRWSSSRRCPSSCSARASARCRPRLRATRPR